MGEQGEAKATRKKIPTLTLTAHKDVLGEAGALRRRIGAGW